jgi:hypothetical protein
MTKRNKIRHLVFGGILATVGLNSFGAAAQAASRPVAIVEESARTDGKGQAFELLAESDTVSLAAGETIILGYLKSCVRETITGGTVTVGAKESVVEGGKVAREKTECAVNKLALTADESQQSATIAFRGIIKHVYTKQPIIMVGTSTSVTIEPYDGGETWSLKPTDKRIDFRAAKLEMQAGKRYKVVGVKNAMIIEVDPAATTAKTGPLERVVILD